MGLGLLHILGGVGLFSVGIYLLSAGFQNAAGSSLRRILAEYTDKTVKGLLTSALISAVIQSSTAVIVTTISFINSRLIRLKEAINIVFGANLGKALTIWIIATIGFKYDFTHYGLYLVGISALIQSFFLKRKSGWILALQGFGLLLFALSILKSSVLDLTQNQEWQVLAHPGLTGMLIYFLLGITMSILMQSSTGPIVLTFSALDAQILNIENATALMIGQNLGSISTSLFASFGQTAVSKRLSSVHALFNLTNTAVSLIMLSVLILFAKHKLFIEHKVIALTSFYSLSIIITLLTLLPFRNQIVRWLKTHFVDSNNWASPQYLKDEKSLAPELAVTALAQEIWHFSRLSAEIFTRALEWRFKQGWVYTIDLTHDEQEMDLLVDDIQWFASKASRKQMNSHANMQPIYYGFTMASRHFENVCDLSKKITLTKAKFSEKLTTHVFSDICQFTDALLELTFLLADVREQADCFLFPEFENVLSQCKTQKSELAMRLLHASSTKEILYSDAMLLLEITDLSLQAVEELFQGTKETLSALQQVPKEFGNNNVVSINTAKQLSKN